MHAEQTKKSRRSRTQAGTRYTVGLDRSIAARVSKYAKTVDTSMGKAIASLVQMGLENQESRKNEFFKRPKANLAENSPVDQDRLVDEFRDLILGR